MAFLGCKIALLGAKLAFFLVQNGPLGAKMAFLGTTTTLLGAKWHFWVPKWHF